MCKLNIIFLCSCEYKTNKYLSVNQQIHVIYILKPSTNTGASADQITMHLYELRRLCNQLVTYLMSRE